MGCVGGGERKKQSGGVEFPPLPRGKKKRLYRSILCRRKKNACKGGVNRVGRVESEGGFGGT